MTASKTGQVRRLAMIGMESMETSSGREQVRKDLLATWDPGARRITEQDLPHVKEVATRAAVHLLWRDLLDLGRRARKEGDEEEGSLLELCAAALVSVFRSVLVRVEGRRTDGCSLLAVAMATTSVPGLRMPVCAELCLRLMIVAGVEEDLNLKVALITANAMVAAVGIEALSEWLKIRNGTRSAACGATPRRSSRRPRCCRMRRRPAPLRRHCGYSVEGRSRWSLTM